MDVSPQHNDLITKRAKRLAERRRQKDVYEKASNEIHWDQSFCKRLQKVVGEIIPLQKCKDSRENNVITDLVAVELALQLLAEEGDDSTTFSALKSGSDNDIDDEKSSKSNYHSNHTTPKELEEDCQSKRWTN